VGNISREKGNSAKVVAYHILKVGKTATEDELKKMPEVGPEVAS
jgi:hypothetical protein